MKGSIYSDEMVAMLRKLAGHGHSAGDIARILTASFGVFLDGPAVRAKAAAEGIRLRSAKNAATLAVPVDGDTLGALRRAARKRALSAEALCGEILRVVTGDGLVGAVLDDGAERQRRRPNGGATVAAAAPRS